MQFTAPYINFNGNSEKQITDELRSIYDVLNSAIEILAKAEYSNGRNAMNSEHAGIMREEKIKALDTLKELREGYVDLFVNLTKKA